MCVCLPFLKIAFTAQNVKKLFLFEVVVVVVTIIVKVVVVIVLLSNNIGLYSDKKYNSKRKENLCSLIFCVLF